MEILLEKMRTALDKKTTSITALASSAGISREYVYKILRRESHPTVPVAEKLANELGMQITLKNTSRKKKPA